MNQIRQLAERMFWPVVMKRRLPEASGSGVLCVSPRVGGLKYVFKRPEQWDPELLGIARCLVKPGDHVWDVGANVGLFSRAAAFHAGSSGHVLAIEADVDAVRLLYRTVRASSGSDASITVLPVAVGRAAGLVRFSVARRARAANAIEGYGSTQTGGVLETRSLPCLPLDLVSEHFPRPNVLKIDVEGAEVEVLSGAQGVLSGARPRVYCEVTTDTRDVVVAMLKKAGYSTFDGAAFASGQEVEVGPSTVNVVGISSHEVNEG